jgi:hypothetical protein
MLTRHDEAAEGRRLIQAYHDGYAGWRAAAERAHKASKNEEAYDVVRALEDKSDAACGVACDNRSELATWVAKVSGLAFPSGPAVDSNQIDLDTWPAAGVIIDGVLWVALQDEMKKPGDLLLTHVVMETVVEV